MGRARATKIAHLEGAKAEVDERRHGVLLMQALNMGEMFSKLEENMCGSDGSGETERRQ